MSAVRDACVKLETVSRTTGWSATKADIFNDLQAAQDAADHSSDHALIAAIKAELNDYALVMSGGSPDPKFELAGARSALACATYGIYPPIHP
jgi:hypothetical protein